MDEPREQLEAHHMHLLLHALETPPDIVVPDDFAARVMCRLPAARRLRFQARYTPTPQRYGMATCAVSLLVLLAAMLGLAPFTEHSALWMTMQTLLFAQFCVLLLWIGSQALRRS